MSETRHRRSQQHSFFVGTFLSALVFDYFSGTSQLSSGDASDSICPKGWGIAGYSGDRSHQKLIANAYGANKTGKSLETNGGYQEYSTNIRIDNILLQSSLSFIRSGRYLHNNGIRNDRASFGFFWKGRVDYKYNATNLYFIYNLILINYGFNMGTGMPVRCVAK